MADSFITQCPHCQVKFKLTESQLNAAKGSVRCGACLNIFNAKDNLAGNQVKSTPLKKPVGQNKVEKPVITEQKIESGEVDNTDNLFKFDEAPGEIQDDISESLFADLDDQESEYNQNNEKEEKTNDFNLPEELESGFSSDDDDMNSLFAEAEEGLNNIFEEPKSENTLEIKSPPTNTDDQLSDIFSSLEHSEGLITKSNSDNNSDLSGLKDDPEEDFVFGIDEPNELEIDENFLNFEENNTDAFTDDAIIAEDEITEKIINADDDTADESWAEELLSDDHPKEKKAVFNSKALGEKQIDSDNSITPQTNKSFYSGHLPANFDKDVTQISNNPRKSQNIKTSVHTIRQDTQELDDLLENNGGGFLSFIAWLFMCLILITILISQYIYFNFDYLSQSKWRPQIIQTCELIGCKVDKSTDPSKTIQLLESQKIEFNGSIKIIFNLRNSQPTFIEYPNLLVQVFDKNNLLLGDQLFTSSEYLPSQIRTENEMRGNSDLKGTVLIKDLGEKAVRYQYSLTDKY
ncbi:MAG: zinc-ribbon domain-containing protein [Saccharospirillaceae bacterium]|nr:zinc-ribbon domain-containing protein [Pseudomonadales bacterium]NRB79049.1 zinc-ribbon domain-containing protein [Saccharospirillaceae bacterium]